MDSNCSNVPRGLCYPTPEPDEAVFTHNESWEKEKPPLSFKAFQEKAFDSSLCLWSRKEGSPRPSMTCSPSALQPCEKGPGPMAAPCFHPRRTPACSGTCSGVHLFNHLDLDFFPESSCLSLAQMSTMSTRAEMWSSEAASASLVALRSCCRCLSLSDSVELCSSSRTSCPS